DPFDPPIPPLPDWTEPIDRFTERNCYAGVFDALRDLSAWAGNRSTSDASGITNLWPTPACAGAQLGIYGTFPVPQPADVHVYLPTLGGGCREVAIDEWQDWRIVVTLPNDIGPGCVGFVRGGGGAYIKPQRVTGELTACIGAAAEIWTRGF